MRKVLICNGKWRTNCATIDNMNCTLGSSVYRWNGSQNNGVCWCIPEHDSLMFRKHCVYRLKSFRKLVVNSVTLLKTWKITALVIYLQYIPLALRNTAIVFVRVFFRSQSTTFIHFLSMKMFTLFTNVYFISG